MTRLTVGLDGPAWTLRESLGEAWRWHVDAPLPEPGDADPAAGWLPAVVPGSVITDLHRAGEIPDPRHARQSRAAEWTGNRSWVLRRAVHVPPGSAGDRAVLELDGLDPGGVVLWDGRAVGEVHGLYRPLRVDLGPAASPGVHRLAVVVGPAVHTEPQVGRTGRVRVHAPRVNQGWDFCPRFPHQGLWRSVRLVLAASHLRDVTVRTDLGPDLAGGRVHVHAVVEMRTRGLEPAAHPGDELRADLTAELTGPDGAPVARTVLPVHAPSVAVGVVDHPVHLALDVDHPQLWWPNRHGPQHRYRLTLRLDGDAAWTGDVGFRHVRMCRNPGAPVGALPCTAVVNGVTVPLVGWNWVPVDAQHGAVRPDRVRHLVDLAARSGARLLRVWGGGLVETDEFYAACDRAGLLVWQELSQSSSLWDSTPATDAAFVELLREEARAVVPPRTHHPSLLMWGGGNELDQGGVPLDEDRSPVLAALREEVTRLDPGRHWVPTSPSGPAFHHRLDVITAAPADQHDVHGPWEHQGLEAQHTLYDAGTALAHTEFGVEGMTNSRSLRALVPPEDRWPADRTSAVYRHLGDWWINAELVRRCFGGRLTDLEALQRASQLLQATGLAYAVEADRRRWPRCSMVLPWQLGESYPNAWCTSAVDFRGDPKPAFAAVTRAFADRRVTAMVATSAWGGHPAATAEAWVWAVDGVATGSAVTATLRAADGTPLGAARARLDRPVGDPVRAVTLTVPLGDVPAGAVLVWDLTWTAADGATLDQEAVLATNGPDLSGLLDLPVAALDVVVSTPPGGDDGTRVVDVVHRGGPVVVGLRLVDDRPVDARGWAVVDADPRPLLPGDAARFTVHWRSAPGQRTLRLESWNTQPYELGE